MKSCVFCVGVKTGLAELLCIFSGPCAFGHHMGRKKQPYKYLSKVYICLGIFRALLYFSGKTITTQTGCCDYKHLCKVHISNGNFNLGMSMKLYFYIKLYGLEINILLLAPPSHLLCASVLQHLETCVLQSWRNAKPQ